MSDKALAWERTAGDLETPTLRDLFALHAPDVPHWFRGQSGPRPETTTIPAGLSKRGEEMAWQILQDRAKDLTVERISPDEAGVLRQFSAAVRVVRLAQEEHAVRAQRDRLIQWRWAFADMMLIARDGGVLE